MTIPCSNPFPNCYEPIAKIDREVPHSSRQEEVKGMEWKREARMAQVESLLHGSLS